MKLGSTRFESVHVKGVFVNFTSSVMMSSRKEAGGSSLAGPDPFTSGIAQVPCEEKGSGS